MTSSHLITSVVALFPNEVTFCGSEEWDFNMFFWMDTVQPIMCGVGSSGGGRSSLTYSGAFGLGDLQLLLHWALWMGEHAVAFPRPPGEGHISAGTLLAQGPTASHLLLVSLLRGFTASLCSSQRNLASVGGACARSSDTLVLDP